MRRVFADTLYWVALANPNDQWRGAALEAETELGDAFLVTTEEVLTEVLASLGGMGEHLRSQAVKMVLAIMADEHVLVIPQSHD
jgi:predicted nucleic acid-binding protein